MTDATAVDIERLFQEGTVIHEAIARAALAAQREYVLLGRPMPVWRDGRVVWVDIGPRDIESAAG